MNRESLYARLIIRSWRDPRSSQARPQGLLPGVDEVRAALKREGER